MSKNGPPLANTMRGIEGRNEQDGCWAEELPHYESHAVILGGRVTDFLFASGQLSGKIIIVCVSVPSLSCMLLDRQEIVF